MRKLSDLQYYALNLMQALLGAISSNFRLVSITLQKQRVVIQIILATRSSEDLEEIEDLKAEFEAIVGPVDFAVEVSISAEPIFLPTPDGQSMCVFRRRE
jgi:hypothetical protein